MGISIGMPTIERADEQYIFRFLDSIESDLFSFVDTINIYDSGSTREYIASIEKHIKKEYKSKIHLVKTKTKLSGNQNISRIFEHEASQSGMFLLVEDDVILCKDFASKAKNWLECSISEKVRMYSLFIPNSLSSSIQNNPKVFIYNRDTQSLAYPFYYFWCTQAVLFYRSDCRSISAKLKTFQPPRDSIDFANGRGWDLVIGYHWYREQYGLNSIVCSALPSLVQHVGIKSTGALDSSNIHALDYIDNRSYILEKHLY